MRIDAALKSGTELLKNTSDSARLDTEILLSHCLSKQRSYLYAWPEKLLNTHEYNAFKTALLKRAEDYPIAYLVGYQEFWSLKLKVTPDVLIPRADTERLVETALEKIINIKKPKILELGTGSGAIAIALATERSDGDITATDVSEAALTVAEENRQTFKVENIRFIKSDWFSKIPKNQYDLIVSNPPYISPTDIHLSDNIRYEPSQALVSECNGLDDLNHIAANALNYINIGSWLILEHGYNQREAVSAILEKTAYQQISCLKDLSGNDRISIGLRPNKLNSNTL